MDGQILLDPDLAVGLASIATELTGTTFTRENLPMFREMEA